MSDEKDQPIAGTFLEMYIANDNPTMNDILACMAKSLQQLYPGHEVHIVLNGAGDEKQKYHFHVSSTTSGPLESAEILTKFVYYLAEREMSIMEQNPHLSMLPAGTTKH